MTQDEYEVGSLENAEKFAIIRMAREACAPNQAFNSDEEWVKRFAALVAAHEREACAKVCEKIEQDRWNLYKGRPPYTGSESGRADPHEQGVSMGAGECAAAIRSRSNEH